VRPMRPAKTTDGAPTEDAELPVAVADPLAVVDVRLDEEDPDDADDMTVDRGEVEVALTELPGVVEEGGTEVPDPVALPEPVPVAESEPEPLPLDTVPVAVEVPEPVPVAVEVPVPVPVEVPEVEPETLEEEEPPPPVPVIPPRVKEAEKLW